MMLACGQGPAHGDAEGWAEAGGGGCAEPPPEAPVEVRLRINANELLPNGPTAFTTTATTGDPPNALCFQPTRVSPESLGSGGKDLEPLLRPKRAVSKRQNLGRWDRKEMSRLEAVRH